MRVKILYRDDENDLCQISSQMELEFAASQYSPLQIIIQPDQAVNSEVVVEVQSAAPVLPLQPLTPNRLSQSAPVRCDRLTARLACVEKKLAIPTLPAHRREKLMEKKSKLEEIIRSRSPVDEAPQVQQAPLVDIVPAPEKTKRCGRRNPSERLEQINRALAQPNLHPKRLERLQQQKAKLEEFKSSEVVDVPAPVVTPSVPEVVLRGPAARLLAIEKILAQPDLPPRRAEKLLQKKERIEQILRQRAEKESSAPVQQVISAPSPCRGPEARLAAINKMLESPDLPPHRSQKLMQQKARIEQRLSERASDFPENRCRGRGRREQNCEKPRARLVVVRRK
jgi:hypothetical protein